MKIALVGIDKIARDQHVPAIAAAPEWELAATASRRGRVDGVEGFDGIDALLAARPDIPVVLVSAKGIELQTGELVGPHRFTRVLYKPFSPREVVKVASEILEAATSA